MNDVPPDIYERVADLSAAIVNASMANDEALADSLRQTLRAYYDELAGAGRSHPFLTEAMADYTHEPVESMRLYELALEQARSVPDEPTHTKMICLAGRLVELGYDERAEAYLRDGRGEAVRCDDTFWVDEADYFSQTIKDKRGA